MIGREEEIREMNERYDSGRPEFIAVYGRRRVGKTYLIDEALKDRITFRHSGLSPVDEQNHKNGLKEQLRHFYLSLQLQGLKKSKCPTSWLEAFFMLEKHLQSIDNGSRQVVFLDELPWMDTPRSGFITALEAFWNGWAYHRDNMMLVVCGSATSWMTDKLINNYGGLYGRLTSRMKLSPFTLSECERFFQSKGITLSRYDIAQGYMVVGGIPYYLDYMRKGLSLTQNIDRMFFAEGAKLRDEYDLLFASVFSNPEQMKSIVQLLGTRHSGFKRQEILTKTGLDDGGAVTKLLKALEISDFIKSYIPFGKSKRDLHYKLTDPFCLFYLKFVQGQTEIDPNFWMHNITSQTVSAWRGIAFEELCFSHISQIKKALDILGVSSKQSSFVVKGDGETEGMQIDLIIDRKDNVLNLCEMKFLGDEFEVDNDYEKKLRHRLQWMLDHINRKQSLQMTLVTTFGLKYGYHSGIFQQVVTLDHLF
jgi:hypothetical protein